MSRWHAYVGRSIGWPGEGRLGRSDILDVPSVDTSLADRSLSPPPRARPHSLITRPQETVPTSVVRCTNVRMTTTYPG